MKICKQCRPRLDQHSLHELRGCKAGVERAVVDEIRELMDKAERRGLELQLEKPK